ncbi:probable protein phosphatase CG10417 isoform X2 [Thrips palmi]|uniref:protein-serine/threonine phosphatase n=1 Tax=Thrips palmi TaxID=161013 RepID=A0A6P9A1Y4_THRPL|nr:probable protein phosphatase CG10417 isoform X2 [Thrips palmi]
MGAYLSEPLTEKTSSDESNEYLQCGLSSMQGWRMTQEDAHNAVLNFDDGTSLFAVYDGHGGHEVAAYCAENFPKFLKEVEEYKNGDFLEALKQAFLGFDNTLTKPEIISVLKMLANNKEEGQSSDEEEEEVSNLEEEACMPIEELLAKYKSEGGLAIKRLKDGTQPASPYLKARRGNSSGAGCSSSSDEGSSSGAGCSSSSNSDQVSSSSANVSAGPSNSNEVNSSDDVPDTQTASPDVGSSGDVKEKEEKDVGSSSGDAEVKTEVKAEVKSEKDTDSSVSSGSGGSGAQQNGAVDSTDKKGVNGDVNHDIKQEESDSRNDAVSSSSPSKDGAVNGEVTPSQEKRVKGKGKAKDKSPRPDPEADESPKQSKPVRTTRISTLQMYRSILKAQKDMEDEDSEDTEDEDDTTFDGGVAESDEDVDGEEEEDDDEEDEDDDEDDDDDSVDEEDEDCDFAMGLKEEPGADSGCTAVVALLKGRDLYVANAGDSRCVVCRNGTAVEMSLDHKPEDASEWQRITNAGGKVTCDGRVNGGLNLSRAIGDHAYKQNKEKEATEQMITALPDIKTLRINPDVDEFMVLACDGIWNYLSSQDVVDFVRKRIQEGKLKMSQICEELFDHCLAPNTLGDGTGCDNMTAVIVKFRPELSKLPVTLTTDSVFDEPIKNEKIDSAGEAEAKPVKEGKEVPSDEVSTSNSLKRSAPANDSEASNGAEHPEKKLKTESGDAGQSSSIDSEAVAVEV